jgi:hypothetical protein
VRSDMAFSEASPMRSEILEQQRALGRRSVAVLPILYPKELLTAFEVHAVEPGDRRPSRRPEAARLQTTCARWCATRWPSSRRRSGR